MKIIVLIKNNLFFVLFLLTIPLLAFMFVQFKSVNRNISQYKETIYRMESDIVYFQDKLAILNKQDSLLYISEKMKLSNNLEVNNEKSKSLISISDIFNRDKTIVIYWSSKFCNECYRSFFNGLKLFLQEKTIDSKIILLCNFNIKNEFKYFIRSNDIQVDCYRINNPAFIDVPVLLNSEYPVCFKIDENLIAEDFFTIVNGFSYKDFFYFDKIIN